MSAILPSHTPTAPPSPHAGGVGPCVRVKSPDAEVAAMHPATETPKCQRKTLEPIDGVRKQISDPTVGQRLKVAHANHSASTSPPSQMLMSLLGKVSPLGIFKVSAVKLAATSAKSGTFGQARSELQRCTAHHHPYQWLQRSFTFSGVFPMFQKLSKTIKSLFFHCHSFRWFNFFLTLVKTFKSLFFLKKGFF